MTRIHRLSVILALLPLACGDSGGDDAGTAGSATATETGGSMSDSESAETGSASQTTGDGDGDMTGDGDGDPATGDGDGDTTGDGDGDTTGDGDGDTTGDGDGDTTGDGDGDPTGDGDGDTTGDGDGDMTGDGDGDPGDGDGDMTGDGDGDGPPCAEEDFVLQPTPPNIMLVLDKSGSMFSNTWDHDNNNGTPDITRWNSLYDVVDNLVSTFDDQIRFGANLFPSEQAQNIYGPQACITSDFPEVTTGPSNGPAILGDIPGPNVVNSYGGTPASIGISTAATHLAAQNPMNPRVMILVTDGAANCDQGAMSNFELFEVYDDALPVLVGDAFNDDDIRTFVVGIDIVDAVSPVLVDGEPNSINPTDKLTEVAAAGGTMQFYNSQDQAQLEAALTNIIDSVQSCIIPLQQPPFFPHLTEVEVGGVVYEYDEGQDLDCENEDGWLYTNDTFDEIELCGAACDALKMTGAADVDYFCDAG